MEVGVGRIGGPLMAPAAGRGWANFGAAGLTRVQIPVPQPRLIPTGRGVGPGSTGGDTAHRPRAL